VVVVGGGPAGAATATVLAGRGHDVLVLDKAAFPREKPCAEYLSPGTVDALRRLGALDAVAATGPAWPHGMRLCTARGSFLVQYPDEAAPRRALGVPRPALDHALLERARECGARVCERALVQGALVEAGRVVGVRLRGGAALRARFVVGADGRHSAVARSLGLERRLPWPRRLGLVARYEGARGVDAYGEMHVGQGLYCGIAPVGNGLVNVGLVGALDARRAGEPIGAYFARRLGELPGAARALAGGWRATPVRGVGPLARAVRGVAGPGYLLVGDAAGFLDPFTGEGVYRALRGGELAAAAAERARQRADGVPDG
jgi:geranylgeranyl reductase family protein